MPSVLVVEDDSTLRLALADNLEDEKYEVATAATLAEARKSLASKTPDVIVLDLMLPDGDGTSLCRELRKAKTTARIIMLTARTLEDDLVKGFDAGADDYLGKPYRLRELLARIGALARRNATAAGGDTKHTVGEWTVDEASRTVTSGKTSVELTRKEFDLLLFLIKSGDAVATRDAILDALWGDVVVDTHTVDNFISSLKKKLKLDVKTVRGVGFRLGR
ncbi:MAG: response regulator transcription factor [Archangium sp.]